MFHNSLLILDSNMKNCGRDTFNPTISESSLSEKLGKTSHKSQSKASFLLLTTFDCVSIAT